MWLALDRCWNLGSATGLSFFQLPQFIGVLPSQHSFTIKPVKTLYIVGVQKYSGQNRPIRIVSYLEMIFLIAIDPIFIFAHTLAS